MAGKYKTERELLKARADHDRLHRGGQHVFYNPFQKANGVVEIGDKPVFVPHGLPNGFALDVEGWVAAGEGGPAKPYRIDPSAPKVKPCKTPGGCPECPDPEPPASEEPVSAPVAETETSSETAAEPVSEPEAETPADAKE